MEVICLETQAFHALVDQVYERLKEQNSVVQDRWIDGAEAMRLLGIGKTTLQKLRNEGKIRYTQPQRKIILYDRDSINGYLERHAKNTF